LPEPQRNAPQLQVELAGKTTEPIRDVTDVRISMYPKDKLQVGTARPAAVGAII
jgi:hypothetical protein